MTTTVQSFYKQSNETSDRSGDYKVITMPAETYYLLESTLRDAMYNGYDRKRAERILKVLDKAIADDQGQMY